MPRQHLAKLSILFQEVILRLISSTSPSANNEHPSATTQGLNTILPVCCLYGEIFKKNQSMQDSLIVSPLTGYFHHLGFGIKNF